MKDLSSLNVGGMGQQYMSHFLNWHGTAVYVPPLKFDCEGVGGKGQQYMSHLLIKRLLKIDLVVNSRELVFFAKLFGENLDCPLVERSS